MNSSAKEFLSKAITDYNGFFKTNFSVDSNGFQKRVKLGWRLGILHPEQGRPKGMHWHTFNRLVQQYRQRRNIAIIAMADELPALRRFKNSLGDTS